MANIKNMRSVIQCGSPWKQDKPAVKDLKFKKTRNLEIFKHNQVLLQKMMHIEQKESRYHPASLKKGLFEHKSSSVGRRLREYNHINAENRVMLGRLQSAKSDYHRQGWVKNIARQSEIRKNLHGGT